MQPWHEKALRKGRTPLRDAPGVRPWVNESGETSASAAAPASAATSTSTASYAANNAPASAETATEATTSTSAPASSDQTAGTAPSYVFWRGDDLRRLVRMRNGGAKWSAIAEAFPDRTLEALKQTFHKRRHATEREMAEEESAEVPASDVEQ